MLDDENMIIVEINSYALKTFVAVIILKVIDNLIMIFGVLRISFLLVMLKCKTEFDGY